MRDIQRLNAFCQESMYIGNEIRCTAQGQWALSWLKKIITVRATFGFIDLSIFIPAHNEGIAFCSTTSKISKFRRYLESTPAYVHISISFICRLSKL